MTDKMPILQVRGLCKYFPVRSYGFRNKVIGLVRAVDDISFDVFRGETLGLVGESGCGKTTASRTIVRALKPTHGSVLFRSRSKEIDLAKMEEHELKKIRPDIQYIFQDPFSSLNPRMTVGSIITEPLVIHRIGGRKERQSRLHEILIRVGLQPEDALRYPHAFSGGQRQRIGIARALILNPSFVICDEPVSALDVSVQAQIINLLKELQHQFELTYIFVAHDLNVIRYISDRVAVMYAGKIVEIGDTETIFNRPGHPYTRTLLSAVPDPDPDIKNEFINSGEVADPSHLPAGCSFGPRCAHCLEKCRQAVPVLQEHESQHWIACNLV